MSVKIKNAIIDLDYGKSYYSLEFLSDQTVEHPFLGGMDNYLVNQETFLNEKEIKHSLFNQKNQAKMVRDVGPNGVYYLYLQPGYVLEDIHVDPSDVVTDIFFKRANGTDDRILFCFYNPTKSSSITITCNMVPDTNGVLDKLKKDPGDLYWRYYLLKNLNKGGSQSTPNNKIQTNTHMNVDEVAQFLNVQPKTIRNWVSLKKIPFVKMGGALRFNKKEIEEAIKNDTIGKPKKRQKKS